MKQVKKLNPKQIIPVKVSLDQDLAAYLQSLLAFESQ